MFDFTDYKELAVILILHDITVRPEKNVSIFSDKKLLLINLASQKCMEHSKCWQDIEVNRM